MTKCVERKSREVFSGKELLARADEASRKKKFGRRRGPVPHTEKKKKK
jgi:hypothetical protein